MTAPRGRRADGGESSVATGSQPARFVRIGGWWIDGFGVLRDHEIGEIDPALTVLVGANEAGKSTQLAFLRYILFGFPKRTTSLPQYDPVRGGKHGGRVTLVEGSERHELWRYRGDKAPRLVQPDGDEVGEEAVARLLGHADDVLFRSVFAFGLSELQSFGELDKAGVREHIFSAGVVGAGRSAREASRQLGRLGEELLKGGKGKARINDLLRDIESGQSELQAAAREAATYGELVAEERRLQASADELRDQASAERALRTHLVALEELWPRWSSARQAESELEGLPAFDPSTVTALRALAERLPVRRDRLRGRGDLQREAGDAERVVSATLDELGPGWTEDQIRAVDPSIPARDEVRQWEQRLSRLAGDETEAARVAASAAQRVEGLQLECEQRARRLPEVEPPTLVEVEAREVIVAKLREERGELRAAQAAAHGAPPGSRRVLSFGAAILFVLAVAFVVAGATRDAGVGLWFGAAAVALTAAVAMALGVRGRGADGTAESRLRAPQARVAERAAQLGLSPAPGDAEVDAVEARVRGERTARVEYEGLRREYREHEAALARECTLLEQRHAERAGAAERLAVAQDEWRDYKAERGFPETLSIEGVTEFLGALERGREAVARRDATRGRLTTLETEARAWEDAARGALAKAGRDCAGLDATGLEQAVEEACVAADRRDDLERRVRETEQELRTRFGEGDEADRVRGELADDDPEIWRVAAQEAGARSADLEREYDETIRRHQDARRSREELERSADVPRLQAELEGLRAELDEAVSEYREVKLAQALVDRTLREFMRTRQPAVLASAGAAFARVTGGRYTAVVQPEDLDDDLRVVDADGSEKSLATLSRGTAEQLYLCLRLGLASEFAARSVGLPFVMDDCLVNFDPERAAATAELLIEFAAANQVLLFTCHPETVELLRAASGGALATIQM